MLAVPSKTLPPVFRDFARGIDILNNTISSDMQTMTPAGRAYKTDSGAAYVDHIHIATVAEDHDDHLSLQAQFRRRSHDYEGTVYAGAAGFMNLGYMAAIKPGAAFLFDVNSFQPVFWKTVIECLASSPQCEEFIEALGSNIKDYSSRLRRVFGTAALGTDGIRTVDNLLNQPFRKPDLSGLTGWLDNARGLRVKFADRSWMQEGYDHLHRMAKENAIGVITLDVCDHQASEALGGHLEQAGHLSGVLYLSNILSFLNGKSDWTGRQTLNDCTPARAGAALSRMTSRNVAIITSAADHEMKWPEYCYSR